MTLPRLYTNVSRMLNGISRSYTNILPTDLVDVFFCTSLLSIVAPTLLGSYPSAGNFLQSWCGRSLSVETGLVTGLKTRVIMRNVAFIR